MENYEKQHLAMLRSGLAECAVLLKKDGSFPLKNAGDIALYGNGARHTVKGGTGSGEVNSRFFVTVEEGLETAGFRIVTKSWLDAYDRVMAEAKINFIKEIRERARKKHTMAVIEGMGAVMAEPEYEISLKPDTKPEVKPEIGEDVSKEQGCSTAVYVLARISGEGNDRNPEKGDICLTDSEIRDILQLNREFERFMLVLNVGGPVDLSPVKEAGNILVLSQLGVETGNALADILLGKAYPSGKLTTTWAKCEDYPEIGDFGDRDDTHYREGVYVGYRYFDAAAVKPMFPFGYGLGYTDFDMGEPSVGRTPDGKYYVSVKVKNIGSYPGKETVQVYIAPPQLSHLDKPLRTLAAFQKTKELQPGEMQELRIPFDVRDAASFDEQSASWILERGDYPVLVTCGNSTENLLQQAGTLRLAENVVLEKIRNLLGKPGFIDWKPDFENQEAEAPVQKTENVFEISKDDLLAEKVSAEKSGCDEAVLPDAGAVNPNTLSAETTSGNGCDDVDPRIAALSDEELAYLVIGGFDPKGGLMSVIGNASSSVAGAAGEISTHYPGGANLVMSDGPAGLRISRDFYRDEKGVHSIGAAIPESITEFMPKILTKLMALTAPKPKKGTEIQHQYCTAIPIGTAIAQSWNPDFAMLCGDVVGEEMERFGIQLWLAPALNIHRSIRCGRNFEYFSEDPLISGIFAAAITDGVQKHPGCGVTIKHFAANNQETNRYNSNSNVSERAMREIYLKGFEIAVRMSQPHALMTSYNLLNGEHTSERADLIGDILRGEWGYKGIVMTDWVVNGGTMDKTSVHPAPEAWKVAAAGGDLFMPGGKNDYKNVLQAMKDGRLPRKQVEINASRVLRMAEKLSAGDNA